MSLTIRPAASADTALVFAFVRESPSTSGCRMRSRRPRPTSRRPSSARRPRAFAEIALWGGEPAGFALWFYNYSTFRGRHGLYLEDLFVRPAFRGRGIARGLMQHLARRCLAEGLPRLEWWVLDWNEPALRFYRFLGAVPMDEWTVQRVTGEALERLAKAPLTAEGNSL